MTDRFETLAVHAGAEPDPHTGAVVPAIEMSTTFKQDGVGGLRGGFEYGRCGNPTRSALEEAIATLEDATHGLAYASGLAATQNILYLLEPGDRLLMSDDVYGGTWRLADKVWRRYGDRDRCARPARPRRGGRRLRRRTAAADGLDRDAVEPAAQGHRHQRGRAPRGGGRRHHRGRQHVRHAVPPAAAGPRRRPGAALRHQVPRRPFGRHRRPDRDALRRAGREAALPPERRRRGAEPVRLLPRDARPADAGDADGARIGQCAGPGALAGGAPRGRARALSRAARPSGGRARRAPDARARRDAQHRAARRRGPGAALRGRHAPLHAGRVARRRRVADRGAGADDPRLGRRVAAGGARRRWCGSRSGSSRSTTCVPTWRRHSPHRPRDRRSACARTARPSWSRPRTATSSSGCPAGRRRCCSCG